MARSLKNKRAVKRADSGGGLMGPHELAAASADFDRQRLIDQQLAGLKAN
jgi:hypothetical protein